MGASRILVVDDEADMLEICREVLQSPDLEILTETDSKRAAEKLSCESYDLLLADLKMPGMDGLGLLEYARKVSPETVILMVTAFPTVETAVEAVKKGAFDYIIKPFTPDQLRIAVRRAIAQKGLKEGNRLANPAIDPTARFDNILGRDPKMQGIYRLIQQIAATNSDVLIVGESGTGKELIARSLHIRGSRRDARFVPIDCGAIPENLLENELFGHERGSFTGAQASSMGLLEFAQQGVLFLDEICELHPTLQSKLLRVLQERQCRRIGGRETIDLDVQVIAATNRDIDLEVKEKRFREDLFYRINVVRIVVPPLRERSGDIPLIADHFLERYAKQWRKEIRGIEKEAMGVLCQYPWPGNVRELQNVIKRSAVVCRGHQITTDDLPSELFESGPVETTNGSRKGFFATRTEKVNQVEMEYLRELIARFHGDTAKAAEEAQLPRGTLYRLMKKHHIKPDVFKV